MTDIVERLHRVATHGDQAEAIATMEAAAAEIERLQEALHQVASWSRAYPLTAFPEPDFKKAAELLKAGGMSLDTISASNMRHVVEGVGKIARGALGEAEQC
jgi:hypothetical protein